MNLRFWGGWFLAIACVCIFLTMGCEKGSLGVKYANVFGRIVNKDNVAMGVPNATVRMISKEAVSGGGELEQGYNFLSTVTDAEGYFVFEKVQPDNVIFEFSAPGYKQTIYPQKSESSSGDEGSSADIESVTIANGASVDLKNIMLEKISQTIPSTIKVKIDFVDKNTKKRIDGDSTFAVTFDGKSYSGSKKASWWRDNGVEEVLGANMITVGVRNDSSPVLYNTTSVTVDGMMDQYLTIELEPVTYSLTFQFLNVPQYLITSTKNLPILSFLVEDYSEGLPAQNISITDVTDFSQLATLEVSAVKNPQNIRIRMHGYRDEVISLTNDVLAGEKGSYRLDVDFQAEDSYTGEDESANPIEATTMNGKIGMFDNMIYSNIEVDIVGLAPNDRCKVVANFIPENVTWSTPAPEPGLGLADAKGEVTATLVNCPSYFDMTYSVIVYPTNPASNTYVINSVESVPIGVPEKNVGHTIIVVDATKDQQTTVGE